MKYEINGIDYPVIITRKNNKNTYIRFKDDMTFNITTSYFTTKKQILNILEQNKKQLTEMINKKNKYLEQSQKFYYMGQKYDIIIVRDYEGVYLNTDKIYAASTDDINKWYKKQIVTLFKERLDYNYNLFKEKIPYPKLKIRTMKTRWGVCNKKDNSVTLNSNLIKYSLDKLDYVIIHELSHFIHFNHSKDFWNTVGKYCSNYKDIRKKLKE